MKLLTLFFSFLVFNCLGQEKDLVYGGLTPQELVLAIKFSNPKATGEFIKIDNMGNGDPFPILVTYETVENINSIRSEDTVKIAQAAFSCIFKAISSDSALLRKKMTTICGTFRIVLHDGVSSKIYYADGYHFSKGYFEDLSARTALCGSDPVLRRFGDIVRAFRLGIIFECR